MIAFSHIQTEAELEQWVEQWQNAFKTDFSVDLSASHPELASRISQLSLKRNQELYLAHSDQTLLAAFLLERKIVSVFPLFKAKVISIGGSDATDSLIIGSDKQKTISEFFAFLMTRQGSYDWINFERNSFKHSQSLTCRLDKNKNFYLVKDSTFHSEISVTGQTFDEYFSNLSKNSRNKISKFNRKLKSSFSSTEQEQITPRTQEENYKLFDEFVELEDRGWKGENQTSILRSENGLVFCKSLIDKAFGSNSVTWVKLQVENRCIAMLLVISRGTQRWVYKTAYDEGYKPYSPGVIVLNEYIRQMFNDPSAESIDLITDYNWHNQWRPKKVPYVSLRVFKRSIKSMLFYWLFQKKDSNWNKDWKAYISDKT